MSMNQNQFRTWNEVRKELFTPEEIAESDLRYAILVDEEFSYLEFYMNRDTISWILKKVGCLSEITAYLF